MQEGCAGEPGHQRGVFDGIPAPVAAPAEHGVGPVHAEADAAGEEEPGDHRPTAGDGDPLLAGVAHHERAEREGEGHGEADVAEVEHRRMDDHLGILEERIEAEAVGVQGAGRDGKGERGEREQEKEEDLDGREDRRRVGVEGDVGLVAHAHHEAIGGEQPGPEEQRAFLSRPERGELVERGQGAVGVVEDVVDREVVGEGCPDEREGGAGDGDEAGDAGAARGLAEGLSRDSKLTTRGQCAQGDSAAEERIDAEHQGEEEREAAEGRHGMQHGRASVLASIFAELRRRRRFAAR